MSARRVNPDWVRARRRKSGGVRGRNVHCATDRLDGDRFEKLGRHLPAWAGTDIRRIGDILTGRDPKVRAVLREISDLSKKFQSLSPRKNSSVAASVAADLVETVEYADGLLPRIRDILRAGGRDKCGDVRSALSLIYEIEIPLLRRRANRLRKNIPSLIEELGGDPSEELLLPPGRAGRRRVAGTGR